MEITAVTFGPVPEKCTSMQIFSMEYLQQRKRSFLHDNKTVWLNAVSSDGRYIQLDKGKYPESLLVFHTQVQQEMLDPAFRAQWITKTAFV